MTTLRVHMFINEQWGRYHLIWYRKFVEYLKGDYNIDFINYNEDGKTFRGNINLQTTIGSFGKNPPLSDVDCVIENLSNNEFVVLTFGKYFTSQVVHYLKSELCLGVLCAHFSQRYMYDHLKINNLLTKLHKVHSWFFCFYKEFDVDMYRNIRQQTNRLNDNLYFKGSSCNLKENSYRKVIAHLEEKEFLQTKVIKFDQYLEELSKQKIALSHYMDLNKFRSPNDHPGELCYRDIEMISIGVPYIRIEYKSELHDGLYPNYHYIVIPREDVYLAYEKKGSEGVSDLFIKKYIEVKDDDEFLKFISNNQKKWYDSYMREPKSFELTIKKLNLDRWKQ